MPTKDDIDEVIQEVSTLTQSLEKFVDAHHDTSSALIQSKIQQAQDAIQSLQEIQDFVNHVVQWQHKLPNKQQERTDRLDTITHQLQTFAEDDIFSIVDIDTEAIEGLEKEKTSVEKALRKSKHLPVDNQSNTIKTVKGLVVNNEEHGKRSTSDLHL
jgi:hypothetical protein